MGAKRAAELLTAGNKATSVFGEVPSPIASFLWISLPNKPVKNMPRVM